MIKSKEGIVIIKGDSECEVIAEFMGIMRSVAINVIVPNKGISNLRRELYKIVDKVCSTVEESED